MGQRGPKPTPRNLRILKGSNRPSRMNEKEPIVEIRAPDPPGHLTDNEADKFREVAAKLAKMRVMSDADVDALAVYAINWCRYLDATSKVREMGLIVQSPKKFPMQNPYLAVSRQSEKTCVSILTEFGLTPSSRTKVHSR